MSATNWVTAGACLGAATARRKKTGLGSRTGKKSPRTILLVDEEERERHRSRTVLENEGYRVLEASEYWEAIAVQAKHPDEIDMLLTAIALPGNNGYELAAAMIAADPALKVLFASGPAGAEVSRFYNMPVAGPHLLSKPVNSADLIARVKHAFRTRRPDFHAQRAS